MILIDDCSTDQSKNILKNYNFKSPHILLSQTQNLGKGAALHKGIKSANGSIIAIQDADFEYDLNDLEKLVTPIILNEADVVYGSRFTRKNKKGSSYFTYAVNKTLTKLSNIFSGLQLTDMETCYKVFRSEIIKNLNLQSKRFGFEPEITAKISKLNIRFLELPINYSPRSYEEGKKIKWVDGIAALWHILYYNKFNKD